jgi:hypothetical protein
MNDKGVPKGCLYETGGISGGPARKKGKGQANDRITGGLGEYPVQIRAVVPGLELVCCGGCKASESLAAPREARDRATRVRIGLNSPDLTNHRARPVHGYTGIGYREKVSDSDDPYGSPRELLDAGVMPVRVGQIPLRTVELSTVGVYASAFDIQASLITMTGRLPWRTTPAFMTPAPIPGDFYGRR